MAPQQEWFEKDYYKVLGVSETASPKEITSAYRKLARELHPDANPGDTVAEERFKDVSAAYDVVGDEVKRKEYDEVRRLGPVGAMGGGFGGAAPGGFSFNADDVGDLFGNLFSGGGRRRGPRGAGPQRGADLKTDLTMEFKDAAEGGETVLHLASEAACSTCAGSGSKPGSAPKVCTHCHGRGVVEENQGMFSFSRPCNACGGKGVIIVDPCPTCTGTGTEHRPRDVKVRIPAGIGDEQTIKLKGRGGPGRNGGPPGDLYVRVHVAPDARFSRSGKDLTITVPVTFPEAALGTRLTVPTLEGDTVRVKLPAGTSSGTVLRVKGHGIDTGRHGRGDLLVTVKVVVPNRLSKEQRAAVEAFAEATTESPRAHLGV